MKRTKLFLIFLITSLTASLTTLQPKELTESSEIYSNGNHQIAKLNARLSIENYFGEINNWVYKLTDDQLDSVIAINENANNEKHTFKYLETGKCISKKTDKWEGNGWVNNTQETYTYDSTGSLITHLKEKWNGSGWVNSSQVLYTYNLDAKQTSSIEQNYFVSNWVNHLRFTFTYDSTANITSETEEIWSASNWKKIRRHIYTYDLDYNLASDIEEGWDGSSWVNNFQINYIYDSNNNLSSEVLQIWNITEWGNYLRSTCTYDLNDNLVLFLQEAWGGMNWVNEVRTNYTYQLNNNLAEEFWELWINDSWSNLFLNNYSYDSKGNLFSIIHQYWQDTGWISSNGYLNVVDSFNNYNRFSGMEINLFYNTVTDIGEPSIISNFELQQNYPNPFNPSTTISYTIPKDNLVQLKVYDIQGKEVANLIDEVQTKGNYNITYIGSNLSSGVYFYRLQSGGFSASKKFIFLK